MNWDMFFLGLAEYVSTCSKDPRTKVGAVLVDDNKRIVSTGYNGFPRGVDDDPEIYANRPIKNRRILHAECNAFLFAQRQGTNLYVTHPPCSQCMAMAIQHGVKQVHWYTNLLDNDWGDSLRIALSLAKEASIEVFVHYHPKNTIMEEALYDE